jgi:transposase
VALHAIGGEETEGIQGALLRSRGFVQRWAYAYRDHGVGGLKDKPRGGRKPRLSPESEAALRARIQAGPRPEDGVCTLRGKDIRRILEDEHGQKYSLNGVYDILHRLGYSCLAPRPRHEKQDPAAQETFKTESAPLFVRLMKEAVEPRGGRVRVFFMDEARFVQQGTLTRIWAPTGSRPTAVKQTRYEWLYLYAAVEPATGASVPLLAPDTNTGTMNAFLAMMSRSLEPLDHAVLIMNQAGWHKSRALGGAGQHQRAVPAAVLTGAQPGGAAVGVPAEPLPQQPRVRGVRGSLRRRGRRVPPEVRLRLPLS